MFGKRTFLVAVLALPLLAVTVAWLWAAGRAEDAMAAQPMDVVLGNADAPVRIVAYVGLRCAECSAFHLSTLPRLQAEWLDTKRAALVYRVVALQEDDIAVTKFLRCMTGPARPDRTGQWLDAAFRNQAAILAASDPVQALQRAGRDLERQSYDRLCLDNPLVEEAVLRGRDNARAVGVRLVPTFFVQGRRVAPEGIERALELAAR
jgi:protein-disulfide isomerase